MHGAIEGAHMGHPDFRANGRIFATLRDDEWGMVKLTPDEQQELLRAHPDVFEPASGAWGREGSTMVRLRAADGSTVRGAIVLAWEHVMSRPAPKKTSPTRPRARR